MMVFQIRQILKTYSAIQKKPAKFEFLRKKSKNSAAAIDRFYSFFQVSAHL
jgi:hypothetical protein